MRLNLKSPWNWIDLSRERFTIIGVAFDHSLSRLGHGKGYYDRFIASYVASGRPKPLLGAPLFFASGSELNGCLVALALREQVLEGQGVPIGDTDWKMDFVVTPDAILSGAGVTTDPPY